jgi:hypothetical protein
MQNNTNPQVKTEVNPLPPPPPEIQEPQQQTEAFPTQGTILTITRAPIPILIPSAGGHKMHIFTVNIPIFHSRYRR